SVGDVGEVPADVVVVEVRVPFAVPCALFGRRATKPMMPAMARAPTTAATSIPLEPDLLGACDLSGATPAGESLGTARGDGMLPGSLVVVGDRKAGLAALAP